MFKFSKSRHPNFLKIYQSAENVFNEIPLVKRRRRLRKIFRFLKYFSYGVLAVFLVIVLVFGFQVMSFGSIYERSISGKNNLEQALFLAREEKFDDAAILARAAQKDFDSGIGHIRKIKDGFFVSRIKILRSQVEDVEYLLNTAFILSQATEQGIVFGGEIQVLLGENKKISFSKFTREEKASVLGRIYESAPELIAVKKNLDLAHENLDKVDYHGMLFLLRGKLSELEEKIELAQGVLEKAIPMSRILPHLAGYPQKSSYLVILQNSDELRPTGGFIGTYGILETEYGDILRFDTHDVYHMDMPVKDKINVLPPEPISKYLAPKWYMRDANWSPDWPTSAEKILWFYNEEDKLLPAKDQINKFTGKFDGVIGVTPEFITGLLEITGPIVVEDQEYNSENFTKILEYRVEKGYAQLGVPSWQRKEVIGEISKKLKIRLLDLPSSRWRELADVMGAHILKKNILVYLKDAELQDMIKERNWTGDLIPAEKDYLMVVDSNMGALKTDAIMKRSISYAVRQAHGGIISGLRINYAHAGGKDWRTSAYKTYTRIYVPEGSRLIKAEGVQDIKTGNEAGKTYFGAYLTVDPGKIKNVYFEYELPERLSSGSYELYAQKQPGSDIDELSIDLSLSNGVKSYSPSGFFANKNGNRVVWETDLKTDRVFRAEQ